MAKVGNITPEDGVDYRRLKPHPKNPNEGDQGAVIESIETNGFVVRILAQKSTGFIIDGEHRWRAGQQAGITEFPVDWLDCTDAEAERLLAAINRTTRLGTDNQVKLAELLAELAQTDLGLKGTGFDDDDLDNLLNDLAGMPPAGNGGDEFDATPTDGPTRTSSGDLWRIGSHRLLVGDSTNAEDVARLLDGIKPAVMMTDPPYGINAEKMTLGTGKKEFHRGDWDSQRPDLCPMLGIAEKVCIWGGNYFADILPVTNDWLCWHKKNDGLSFSEFELAWTNFGKNTRILSHHWSGENKEHPTQKPLPVIEWALTLIPDGDVFDPFLGSGTTLIASERANRRCFGIEIDPIFADVCLRRAEAEGIHPIELIEHGR